MPTTETVDTWDWINHLPPCCLCGKPLTGWITSDGVHYACIEEYPDVMVWRADA